MRAIELTISGIWLPLIILVSAFAGYIFRGRQLKQSKKKILSLENEMLDNHAEILKLQQQLSTLKNTVPGNKSLVVSMKESSMEESAGGSEMSPRKRVNS